MVYRLKDEHVRALITAVKNHRCLWDHTEPNFKSVHVTKPLWEEIGHQIGISGYDAKSKWKNVKDNFRKVLFCKRNLKPNWRFYDDMLFTKGVLLFNPQRKKVLNQVNEDNDDDEEEEVTQMEDGASTLEDVQEGSVMSVKDFLEECQVQNSTYPATSRIQMKTSCAEIDSPGCSDNTYKFDDYHGLYPPVVTRYGNEDDYHFLMSLMPYFTDLQPFDKLELRCEIQKLVLESFKKYKRSEFSEK